MHDTKRECFSRVAVGLTGCTILCACSELLQIDKFSFESGGGVSSRTGGTSSTIYVTASGSGGIGGILLSGGTSSEIGAAGPGSTATGGAATSDTATGGATHTDPTRCPSLLEWHDLQYYAASGDRTVPIAALAGGVAVIEENGTVRCPAARISNAMLLTVDCVPSAQETFNFGSWRSTLAGYAPMRVSYCPDGCSTEAGRRFNLHCSCASLDGNQYPLVPWSRRRIRPAEQLSLVAFDDQGMAVAAHAWAPSFDIFASPTGASADRAKVSLVFGEDSQLLGFCGRGSDCDRLAGCTSVDSIINDSLFELHWRYSLQNAFFSEISGDGRADAVTAFPNTLDTVGQVTDPATGLLGSPAVWLAQSTWGNEQTFLADVTGDGKDDIVSVSVGGRANLPVPVTVRPNGSTAVSVSRSTYYYSPVEYYAGDIKGSADIYWGDVNGVAGEELVIIGNGQILVRRPYGLSFAAPDLWGVYDISTNPIGFAVADVTGDARADIIIILDTQLQVMPSTGNSFGAASVWLDNVSPGAPGWYFARLDSDKRADAILIDSNNSTVYLAGTNGFAKSATPFAAVPIGERGNYFADVTGDGLDDAIVLNHQSARVYPSMGSDFGTPIQWYDKPLYGGL